MEIKSQCKENKNKKKQIQRVEQNISDRWICYHEMKSEKAICGKLIRNITRDSDADQLFPYNADIKKHKSKVTSSCFSDSLVIIKGTPSNPKYTTKIYIYTTYKTLN